MRLSDLIFNATAGTAWDSEHLWLTLLIIGIASVFTLVSLIMCWKERDDISTVIPFIITIILSILLICLAPTLSQSTIRGDINKQNEAALSAWVTENYALDLTDNETKSLLINRSNYNKNNSISGGERTIVTFYGVKTMVSLVKHDKEWFLFSYGESLVKTTTPVE